MRRPLLPDELVPLNFLLILLLLLLFTSLSTALTCDDDVVLPASFLNDDYCDCMDRSDEPLTSACSTFNVSLTHPSSTFLCPNLGFLSLHLPTTFLSDRICDCCDGSDEPFHLCPNSCHTQATHFLSHHRSIVQKHRAALSHRTQLLPRMAGAQSAYRAELQWVHSNLPGAYQEKAGAEAAWEALPEAEKRSSPAALESMQRARQSYAYLLNRYHLLAGALGQREVEQLETEAEAAERVRQRREQEKALNKEKRARGEKVRKKTAAQLRAEEEDARPRPRSATVKAPSILLSDVFLTLHSLCVSTVWEERLYGDKGVSLDHYLVTLCPLHNATQTKLPSPSSPPLPGTPAIVLGHFEGVVRTPPMLSIQHRMDARRAERGRIEAAYGVEQRRAEPEQALLQELQWRHNRSVEADEKDLSLQRKWQERAGRSEAGGGEGEGGGVDALEEPQYWLRYFGGEACYGAGQREVLVKMACGADEVLQEVRENGKCRYEMTFLTAAACESRWVKEATAQMDRLEAEWTPHWPPASHNKDEL